MRRRRLLLRFPLSQSRRLQSTDLSSTIALTAEFSPYQEVDVMAKSLRVCPRD